MFKITVKTLDGQDRPFEVSGDMTVKQFKDHIAPSVGIANDRQRVIFQGRVLQDDKRLDELDLNGKAVHLVEKPANRSSELSQNTVLPHQPHRRREVAQQQVMIGSVAIPIADLNAAELVESIRRVLDRLGEVGRGATINVNQSRDGNSLDVVLNLRGIPSSEIESPALARLQHVRHVIRHINHSLYHMENDETPREESQSASSPRSQQDRIDTTSPIIPDGCNVHNHNASQNADVRAKGPSIGGNAPPRDASSAANGDDLRGVEPNPTGERDQRTNNRVRNAMVSDLANVFEEVMQLEERLRPHRQRYLGLLRDEADFSQNTDEGRSCSRFFNGMQIIMHNISHVYHVLSDLNIHFCEPPPRILDPRMNQTDSTITVHQAEAQITMSFRRANGSSGTGVSTDQSNPSSGSAASAGNPLSTSQLGQMNVTFGNNEAPSSHTNVRVHPDGVITQTQTASFSIPIQQMANTVQQTVETGDASAQSAPQNQQQSVQNQQPANFFQQLMQGVANAGVLLGLAPTMAGAGVRQPNQQAAMTPNQQIPPPQPNFRTMPHNLMQTNQPQVGIQFGGRFGGPFQAGQQNMANILRGLSPGGGGIGFMPGNQPIRIHRHQHPSQTIRPNINPMQIRHPQAGAPTVIVNATNSDPIFIGPRPPVDLPLFTVDPYLPCPSRHFDLRNRSPINRRRDVNAAGSAPVASMGQQATSNNDDDHPLSDINEFEATIEQILRSVLEGMNDQPINNPASLGMYNFVPVGGSVAAAVGHSGDGFQAYVVPVGVNVTANLPSGERQLQNASFVPPFGSVSASLNAADGTFSMTNDSGLRQSNDAVGGSENEMSVMIGRLFQTLAQNPTQPMSEFMRSLGRDLEEPGTSVFSNIVHVLTQVVSLSDLIPLFSRMSLAPLNQARTPLRRYFIENVLNGNDRPSEDDLRQAVSRVVDNDMEHFQTLVGESSSRDNVDLAKSMLNAYESRLLELMKLCFGFSDHESFGERFYDIIWICLQETISLGVHYNVNGASGFEDLAVNYLNSSMSDLSTDVQDIMTASGRDHIRNMIANHILPESSVQQYVVNRASESDQTESSSVEIRMDASASEQVGKENLKRSAKEESSSESEFVESRSAGEKLSSTADDEWKSHLPAEWIKVIEVDVERQRGQSIQKPFSDAYLNGMPMKRRKVVCESKPNLTVDSESMFQQTLKSSSSDVSATPITGSSIGDVANSTALPVALLETFEEDLNERVRRRLQHDPDFDEKRFPNVKQFFDS